MRQQNDKLQARSICSCSARLTAREAMHGTDISDRIAQSPRDVLRVEEGSLYPALHRMEEAGWVTIAVEGVGQQSPRPALHDHHERPRRLSEVERRWTEHVSAVMRVLRMA